jgi:hypothetical protein
MPGNGRLPRGTTPGRSDHEDRRFARHLVHIAPAIRAGDDRGHPGPPTRMPIFIKPRSISEVKNKGRLDQ